MKPNKYAHLADGTVLVMLERKDGTVLACRIDGVDWVKVRSHRWSAQEGRSTFYAHTGVRKADSKKTTLKMHTLLLPNAVEVDHKDLNGLNNQRSNIRASTSSQNAANRRKQNNGITSPFKGVSWHKAAGKYRADIRVNGKLLYLGLFIYEVEAAIAYDEAALKYFGKFSRLNFPLQQLPKAA